MEDALGLAVDLIVEEVVVPYPFVREGMEKDRAVMYEAGLREVGMEPCVEETDGS